MARENTGSATNFFRLSSNMGLTAYPCTLSCWFYPDSVTFTQVLMNFTDGSVDFDHLSIYLADTTNFLHAEMNTLGAGQSESAITSNSFTISTWNHCVGVFATSTDRRSYLNGDIGNSGSNTNSMTFPSGSVDRTVIGKEDDLTGGFAANGRLAEVGWWDVELTENEVVSLAAGVSPIRIRPDGLLGYWPLHGVGAGDEMDYSGNGRNMVEQGTMTVGEHSPTQASFGLRAPSLPFGGQIAGIDRRVGLGEIVGNVGHGE